MEKAQTITYDTQTWLGRCMSCRHPVIAVRYGLTEHEGNMLSFNQKPRPMVMVKFLGACKN